MEYDYSILIDHFPKSAIEEFKTSAINPRLCLLNAEWLNGDKSIAELLPKAKDTHDNKGSLRKGYRDRYDSIIKHGGTAYKGIDIAGGCIADSCQSFKPLQPRLDKEGKPIKYDNPPNQPSKAFLPIIDGETWLAISNRVGVNLPPEVEADRHWEPKEIGSAKWRKWCEDLSLKFLEWIKGNPSVPTAPTEGSKKALAGISIGVICISLPGIWNGCREKTKGVKDYTLIDDFKIIATPSRKITIAFDKDSNPNTVKNVRIATKRLAKLFIEAVCDVFEAEWESEKGKGIDDLIVNCGADFFHWVIDNAKAIKQSDVTNQSKVKSETNNFKYFTSSIEDGLVKVSFKDDEDNRNEIRESIGDHLVAIAYIDNPEQDGAALLLEFKTLKGEIRSWTMLRAFLAGDASSIVEGLFSRGYFFPRKQKGLLLDYLYSLGANIAKTYTVTDSSGWVGKSFVLPHKTYGDENLKFRDVDPSPEAITELKGTLQGWKENVAARCAGNSRLVLALGASFAAPLLPIVDIESGGFHLVGPTSKGKTTILLVAASVTGVKGIPHWRTTTNGLESTATAFNHLCLPLDEIGQADPKDVGNIAYMLANGQGKARMKKDLTNRKGKTWRVMVLSSGEVGLGNYMAQANITQKGGQEVRLPDVPAIPEDAKFGCFETIHEADTAVQFVSALEAAVKEYHGTALDAFLSRLVVDVTDPTFAGNLSKQVHLIAAKLFEGTKDSAIGRVAKRYALVQVSLGLAHKYGLLPFDVEDIAWAISKCFKAWLKERGGDGSIEIKQAIERIKYLLVTNEFSDRVYDLRDGDDNKVRNLLAYRKVDKEGDTEEFWVPPSVFDREFCNGVNKTELVKELQQLRLLSPSSADGRPTFERRVRGKKSRFFVFHFWIFWIHEKNDGDSGDSGDSEQTPFPACV